MEADFHSGSKRIENQHPSAEATALFASACFRSPSQASVLSQSRGSKRTSHAAAYQQLTIPHSHSASTCLRTKRPGFQTTKPFDGGSGSKKNDRIRAREAEKPTVPPRAAIAPSLLRGCEIYLKDRNPHLPSHLSDILIRQPTRRRLRTIRQQRTRKYKKRDVAKTIAKHYLPAQFHAIQPWILCPIPVQTPQPTYCFKKDRATRKKTVALLIGNFVEDFALEKSPENFVISKKNSSFAVTKRKFFVL